MQRMKMIFVLFIRFLKIVLKNSLIMSISLVLAAINSKFKIGHTEFRVITYVARYLANQKKMRGTQCNVRR